VGFVEGFNISIWALLIVEVQNNDAKSTGS
jgi:hypothetical protein